MIKTTDTTNKELVSAWNVLMFATKTLGNKDDLPAKIAEVAAELTKRGIPHEYGKRTVAI
jgi:hypothetical protein